MKATCKILSVDLAERRMIVRYYTKALSEEKLATAVVDGVVMRTHTDTMIDLPAPAPVGEELLELLARACPFRFFERHEVLLDSDGSDMQELVALAGQELEVEKPLPRARAIQKVIEDAIDSGLVMEV